VTAADSLRPRVSSTGSPELGGSFKRSSVQLGLVKTTFEWFGMVDVRAALPLGSAATLVSSRRDALFHHPAFGRYST
jgi:hypothetical protein